MVYRLISRLYPKGIKKNYIKLLRYSNIRLEPSKFTGFILSFGFVLGWMIAFYMGTIFNFSLILTFAISFIAFELAVYMWLLLRVDAKAKFIEKVLPDALQLTASNLKAGLTIDKAFLLSARPEFGPLTEEINRVGKEITVGKDIDEALISMTKRVKSDKLEKTIFLIVSGLKSGGQLASLLEQTSNNLRNQEFVEEKIRSSVGMYVIFIFAAVGFGAPLLYGLSSFLVEVLKSIIATVELPETAMALPLSITQINISTGFIMSYVITSLIMISIFGSLIIGLISKGEEKYGFKYIPILIGVTLSIFFIVRLLIKNMLGSLFGL